LHTNVVLFIGLNPIDNEIFKKTRRIKKLEI